MFGFIEFIKRQKERRCVRKMREETLKDIKEAKKVYLDNQRNYMCSCFKYVNKDKYQCVEDIQKYIPEFNPACMNAEKWASKDSMWWLVSDRESRIKAFDKLIEIYSK